MNKISLLLLCGICCFVTGCSEKKNRLTSNTLTITLDPSLTTPLSPGGSISLKAICRSAASTDVDIAPTWIVDSSSLGACTPSTGKATVFTAGNAGGSGTIQAVYGEISSAKLNIAVNTGILSAGVLFADAGCSTDLVFTGTNGDAFNYFDGGDGSPDAEPWRISVLPSAPGCGVDSQSSLKVSYIDGAGMWGGIFLQFSAPKNMSLYSKLTFYAKGAIGNERFRIAIKDNTPVEGRVESTSLPALTTSWQKIEIPLTSFSGVDRSILIVPFTLAFTNDIGSGNATVYIDYITYE